MVWLNAMAPNGNALYFDIYRSERQSNGGQPRYSFAGILGDGLFEGEVQIELGTTVSVTFADAWLNPSALEELFTRVDRRQIEAALGDSCLLLAEQVESEAQTEPRPHRQPARRRTPREAEESSLAFS